MKKWLPIVFVFAFFANTTNGQSKLAGRIYEKTTDSILAGINIFNTHLRSTARSAADGRYSIIANEGDRVIFSGSGFVPDTVTVTFDMLLTQYDVTLYVHAISLNPVTVRGSYRTDSLNRRNEYRYYFEDLKKITGGNRPTDGVGISVSPLSFFSQKAKRQRALRKRLEKEEREAYIDHIFPKEWVEQVTGLHDDSLHLFMYLYCPSYQFCRKTDRVGMLSYVNTKLKEFKKAGR